MNLLLRISRIAVTSSLVMTSVLLAELPVGLKNTQDPADHPISPRHALQKIRLPEGFIATLFAGEPDVSQPISMTIDARGRLWVAQCFSSPNWTKKNTGPDRILIFEDSDHDGTFDTKKVFADNLPNLTSIEIGLGGVWATCAPNLIFIPDADRDDIPDGPAQVKLNGWTIPKHNLFNGLTWGPDGWLYGCHGILGTSHIGKPGTPQSNRAQINCGIWRYHPTDETFEVVCHGTTNPWGLDFDERGQAVFTNCVIGHLWHLLPGAHYERMFGSDFNPHLYQLLSTTADHVHWAGGDWTSSRFGVKHDDAGGGHAHSGAMVYLGDNWPDEYRGNVFLCNIHGNRVNRDRLRQLGSGLTATHEPDFMFANDAWFRGLELIYGPDGGVFVSDWNDFGECHDEDGVHRSSGRIYKVVYEQPNVVEKDLDLYRKSNLELVELQRHKNAWYGRVARKILQERASSPNAPVGDEFAAATSKLSSWLDDSSETSSDGTTLRLRALWSLHAMQRVDRARLIRLFQDHDENLRAWAIRLSVDQTPVDSELAAALHERARVEQSPVVHMQLASALGRLPVQRRAKLAYTLSKRVASSDEKLALMLWYGIEPVVTQQVDNALTIASTARSALVRRFIARRLLSESGQHLDRLIAAIVDSTDVAVQADLLVGTREGLYDSGTKSGTATTTKHLRRLLVSSSPLVRQEATLVGAVLGDRLSLRSLVRLTADRRAEIEARREAVRILGKAKSPSARDMLLSRLADKDLRIAALESLTEYKDGQVATEILANYSAFDQDAKFAAISTLVSRPVFARKLIREVGSTVLANDIRPYEIERLRKMKNSDVTRRLNELWPQSRSLTTDKKQQLKKYTAILGDDVLKFGDAASGKTLYKRQCGQCHKMYGEGGTVGPDLTGSGRHDLYYLLHNIVDPSAVVAKSYRTTTFSVDGKLLTGVVLSRNKRQIQLQTPDQIVRIDVDDIEGEKPSDNSLMPDGLLDQLTDQQLRDLVAFLMSKNPS